MKILIDLDQTILQTSKTLIVNWNKLNPNNKLEYKEPVEWDFQNILSGTNITLKQLCSTFDYKYFYEEAVLFDDCLEVINKWIKKGYEVIVLTKHDKSRRPITKEFIDNLFNNKVSIDSKFSSVPLTLDNSFIIFLFYFVNISVYKYLINFYVIFIVYT